MDTPDLFECRLVGYSKQSRKDGDWVEIRFHIHPDDVTPALAQAPLKTVFMVAATPADKQPEKKTYEDISSPRIEPKRKWDEISLPEQAGIRCADPQFQEWLITKLGGNIEDCGNESGKEVSAAFHVRLVCGVDSRSELQYPNDLACNKWLALDEEYLRARGLITERTT